MAFFKERAAHLVNRMFSLLSLFVVLVVSQLGFEDGNLVLDVPFTGHCLSFTFHDSIEVALTPTHNLGFKAEISRIVHIPCKL